MRDSDSESCHICYLLYYLHIIASSRCKEHLDELENEIRIKRLIIVYTQPRNLYNLLSSRNLHQHTGPAVSSFHPGSFGFLLQGSLSGADSPLLSHFFYMVYIFYLLHVDSIKIAPLADEAKSETANSYSFRLAITCSADG